MTELPALPSCPGSTTYYYAAFNNPRRAGPPRARALEPPHPLPRRPAPRANLRPCFYCRRKSRGVDDLGKSVLGSKNGVSPQITLIETPQSLGVPDCKKLDGVPKMLNFRFLWGEEQFDLQPIIEILAPRNRCLGPSGLPLPLHWEWQWGSPGTGISGKTPKYQSNPR